MHRPRTSRAAVQLALASLLVLSLTGPAAATSQITAVVLVSSPFEVTVGKPVAYPVAVHNTGRNTLNHVEVRGLAPADFMYLGAEPASICSQTEPVCSVGQLASGASAPPITFYFLTPAVPGSYGFTAQVMVAEGGNDNSDGTSNNQDTFLSNTITTVVSAINADFVAGHSYTNFRTFTTGGIDCVGAGLPPGCSAGLATLDAANPHGTAVTVPVNAEVTATDVPPDALGRPCPADIADACFGWGTVLDIADGSAVSGGIEVTMRWDYTQLPNGMTARKLRVVHIFDEQVDGQTHAFITDACTSATQTHCFTVAPFKLSDKDIQATFRLPFNGIGRGWG